MRHQNLNTLKIRNFQHQIQKFLADILLLILWICHKLMGIKRVCENRSENSQRLKMSQKMEITILGIFS